MSIANDRRCKGSALLAAAAFAAGCWAAPALADSTTISACVHEESGKIRIVPDGTACRPHEVSLQWSKGGTSASLPAVQYITATPAPGLSVAQALCPPGTIVVGGGGLTGDSSAGLTQSFPISDPSGVIAFGSTAIGWQAAAENFGFVQAFVVCIGP